MLSASLYLLGSAGFLAGTLVLARTPNAARVLYGLGSLAFAAGTIAAVLMTPAPRPDTCSAPCRVDFPAPMAEDNFAVDYRDGSLYVIKTTEGR